MKIAVFHELSFGGARRVVDMYARELSLHHEIDVYYVDSIKDLEIKKYCSRDFFFSFHPKAWKGSDWKTRLYKDTGELWNLRTLHKRIAKEIDRKKYDLVFVHPSKLTQAPFVLSFLKTPSAYYCQEPLRNVYDPYVRSQNATHGIRTLYDGLALSLRKRIDEQNVRHSDRILANSVFSRTTIWKAYKKKAHVCYLGVDEKLFTPVRVQKKFDVLFLGGTVPIEGYDLLQAARELSKRTWDVKVISRNQQGKGVSDAELVKTINQSRCVVCLSRNEPFGLTVIEAGACGVPVIAVRQGGYKESVIDGKTGILIARDARELSGAINKLLSQEKTAIQYGQAAHANILQFWTWKESTARLEKLLKSPTP